MPRYTYRCKKCEGSFDIFHGMNEIVEVCAECSGQLEKMYFVNKTSSDKSYDRLPDGTLVKRFIEDAKNEIKEYKKELKRTEYKK